MEQNRKPRDKSTHLLCQRHLIFDKGGKNIQWRKDNHLNKVKRQLSEWEKVIVNETTDKELISKIYK